jgi:hypothetical protein
LDKNICIAKFYNITLNPLCFESRGPLAFRNDFKGWKGKQQYANFELLFRPEAKKFGKPARIFKQTI